jgi:hypothetical protein
MMRILLPVVSLLLAVACTTTRVESPGGMAAVAPVMSVEGFLQAANARDLHAMGRLFGTEDGPIIETGSTLGCAFKKMGSWIGIGGRCLTVQEVEVQMDLIARVLRHEDYAIASEADVPGRVNPTRRIGVDLTIGSEVVRDVPFVVVRTSEGRWLIEEIGLEKVTTR